MATYARKNYHQPIPPYGDVQARRERSLNSGPWLADQFGTPAGVHVHDVTAGKLRLRVYEPPQRRVPEVPSPAILHIHGGGMIMGTVEGYDARCKAYAHATGFPVFSVDYRLAPEHPYPAAIDDCVAAFDYLTDSSLQHTIDPARIALLGNSAGAGLAAGTALRLRDEPRTVRPMSQVLIYPMLDDRTTVMTPTFARTWLRWSFVDNRTAWEAYLSGPTPVDSYAAPARATDLRGLPHTYICVGTADIFFDECTNFAAALSAAGVPTEFHVIDGAPHDFDYMAPTSPAAKKSWRSRFEFLVNSLM